MDLRRLKRKSSTERMSNEEMLQPAGRKKA